MKNLSALLVVICLVLPALGTDRLVPSQYSTIQAAISAAVAGDTIIISPGIYSGASNSNLNINSGRPIIIRSADPANPEIVAATIIDCFDTASGYNPAFRLDGGGSVRIEGLTIINGYNSQGGGIIFRNAFASLRNCVFEECIAWTEGGSIYSENSILTLSNCIFRDSYSDLFGGTIMSRNSKIEIYDCTIDNSFARDSGGAIYGSDNSDIVLVDSVLNDNWSQHNGGALYVYNSKSSIKGCEFTGNTVLGAGIWMGGAVYVENSAVSTNTLVVADSNFTDNFSSGNGGAVYCKNQPLNVTRSYFIGNISQQSGGGICYDSNIMLTNSVLSGNTSSLYGAAIDCSNKSQNNTVIMNCTFADVLFSRGSTYFINTYGKNIEISNSIFWGVSGTVFNFPYRQTLLFAYNDVQGGKFPTQTGIGNIQIDPLFVNSGKWSTNSYIPGDYRLNLLSPVINVGDPNTDLVAGETDIDDNLRRRLGRIDIGAYEATSHPMDFDQNGIVNFADLSKIAEVWLWEATWHE